MTPRAAIEAIERDPFTPSGSGDLFSGWGVLGVRFQSGHVLALRRYLVSALGPAYTSIWHRDPLGRWTFYSTVSPDRSCARFYGARIERNQVTAIDLEWTTPWTLRVRVRDTLTWAVGLRASPTTRLFNATTHWMPGRLWHVGLMRRAAARVAEGAFGRACMHRTGRTPNGHRFVMHPRQVWLIGATTADLFGQDLGPLGPRGTSAAPDEMGLPPQGLFAVTSVRFERPSRGASSATRYGTPCSIPPAKDRARVRGRPYRW